MRANFQIIDPTYFAKIIDYETYGENILNCLGSSELYVGDEVISDNLEIAIRIAEILAFADAVLSGLYANDTTKGFNYKFEQPFLLKGSMDGVYVISRINEKKILDYVNNRAARELQDNILAFVNTEIEPISPFLALMINDRKIL